MRRFSKREKDLEDKLRSIPKQQLAELCFNILDYHASSREKEKIRTMVFAATILELNNEKKRSEFNSTECVKWMDKHDQLEKKYNRLKAKKK